MNNQNKLLIIGGVVAVAVIAVAFVAFSGRMNPAEDPAAMQKEAGPAMESEATGTMAGTEAAPAGNPEGTPSGESGAMMKKGSYEAYGPEKLALANEGKVILFFRASWCPTCKVLDADIRSNLGSIPEGVTILDVDYDNSTELKKKYNVTYQHTLVQVDASGNMIAKWSGSSSLSDIVASAK